MTNRRCKYGSFIWTSTCKCYHDWPWKSVCIHSSVRIGLLGQEFGEDDVTITWFAPDKQAKYYENKTLKWSSDPQKILKMSSKPPQKVLKRSPKVPLKVHKMFSNGPQIFHSSACYISSIWQQAEIKDYLRGTLLLNMINIASLTCERGAT